MSAKSAKGAKEIFFAFFAYFASFADKMLLLSPSLDFHDREKENEFAAPASQARPGHTGARDALVTRGRTGNARPE
ncbi:MAG TPA: hypothetical protein VFL63_10390 [Rhodanobacteraceae bacterium]|nr:hypothetical protein [Rhodanobacteraceae bacterium]